MVKVDRFTFSSILLLAVGTYDELPFYTSFDFVPESNPAAINALLRTWFGNHTTSGWCFTWRLTPMSEALPWLSETTHKRKEKRKDHRLKYPTDETNSDSPYRVSS
jgi:hypothetical protein